MPVVAVCGVEDTPYEPAPTRGRWNGNHVPYGVAGVIVDTCTVLCPECYEGEEGEEGGIIFGNEEADYPGLWCEGCDRSLDTHLLCYDSGPGREILPELDEWCFLRGHSPEDYQGGETHA